MIIELSLLAYIAIFFGLVLFAHGGIILFITRQKLPMDPTWADMSDDEIHDGLRSYLAELDRRAQSMGLRLVKVATNPALAQYVSLRRSYLSEDNTVELDAAYASSWGKVIFTLLAFNLNLAFADDSACSYFSSKLSELPHTKLTQNNNGFKSVWNGKWTHGCEIIFKSHDSIVSGYPTIPILALKNEMI